MKLGKAISVEHIKRMTLRTVRESNEGQPEFLAFMNALERNDFDENLCKREARHLEQVMTTKVSEWATGGWRAGGRPLQELGVPSTALEAPCDLLRARTDVFLWSNRMWTN